VPSLSRALIGFVAVLCTDLCVGKFTSVRLLLNSFSVLFLSFFFSRDVLPQVQAQTLSVVSCKETLSYRTGALRTHCTMSSAETLGAIQNFMYRLGGKPQKFPVMLSCNLDYIFFRNFQT
jgi:hypothetical protein